MEYQQLQKNWKWNIPKYYNIGEDCTDKHLSNPGSRNKTAIIWESEQGEIKRISYLELYEITNKTASVMQRNGIEKGDRIIIRLDNDPEFVYLFLAATKLGAVPIPTSYMFTGDEVGYILDDSQAKCVVTSHDLYDEIDNNRDKHRNFKKVIVTGEKPLNGCIHLESSIEDTGDVNITARTLADEPAYMCYTSGTTGFPKGVVHAHRVLIGHDPSAFYWQALKKNSVVFHCGKLNWTYTLGTGVLDPLRHGCTSVIYCGAHDPARYFDIIDRHEVDVFMAVPTVYRHMLRYAESSGKTLSTLRHGLSAGEHLSTELFKSCEELLYVTLYDGFGMSEFSYYLSNMPGFGIKPGSPGRPQPGHFSKITDEEGKEVATGEKGILATPREDPGIMLGYWNKAAETEKMFAGNLFMSGDYFYTDNDGYYWYCGREDDLITSFGYRISPFEIERVLLKHVLVEECAVTGIKIDDCKTITCAFIVPTDEAKVKSNLSATISDYLSKKVANYKVPKRIITVDSIPKTANGKIKRAVLNERYSLS